MSKSKEELLDALSENIPVVKTSEELVVPTKELPSDESLKSDAEEDFELVRNHIKGLIDTSNGAISMMTTVADEAEHPRAFEVLGTLMKQSADMGEQLLDLQKKRKELLKDKDDQASRNTTNNNLIMTTTDLQKMLKNESDKDVVDVNIEKQKTNE